MVIATTAGIKISVKNFFRPEFSDLRKRHYLFSYQIQIENQSGYAVQLLRRHWHIFDSSGEYS
ncbi:MAG: Co2+/Mg2+ efflux protein ApaG, partial [Flavobacteriales bacterium]